MVVKAFYKTGSLRAEGSLNLIFAANHSNTRFVISNRCRFSGRMTGSARNTLPHAQYNIAVVSALRSICLRVDRAPGQPKPILKTMSFALKAYVDPVDRTV